MWVAVFWVSQTKSPSDPKTTAQVASLGQSKLGYMSLTSLSSEAVGRKTYATRFSQEMFSASTDQT